MVRNGTIVSILENFNLIKRKLADCEHGNPVRILYSAYCEHGPKKS